MWYNKREGINIMEINVQVTSKIPELIRQINQTIFIEQQRQARMMLSKAQIFCPVITGFLKSSGYEQTIASGGSIVSTVGFSAEYAIYVEAKQHFLYRAFTSSEASIQSGIMAAISRLL